MNVPLGISVFVSTGILKPLLTSRSVYSTSIMRTSARPQAVRSTSSTSARVRRGFELARETPVYSVMNDSLVRSASMTLLVVSAAPGVRPRSFLMASTHFCTSVTGSDFTSDQTVAGVSLEMLLGRPNVHVLAFRPFSSTVIFASTMAAIRASSMRTAAS